MKDSSIAKGSQKGLRGWPAVLIVVGAVSIAFWIRSRPEWSFQEKNLRTLFMLVIAAGSMLLWWTMFSRILWRFRLAGMAMVLGLLGLGLVMFRIRGVSGDVLPILEPRWLSHAMPATETPQPIPASKIAGMGADDFPQFLGPHRTAKLESPVLKADWKSEPPKVLWRQPIGAAWSGWAMVGHRALTQEQRSGAECCTCYDAVSGQLLWSHSDDARYQTTIAGEGPRCTPTVVSNRVFTLGATGILNCLELETGRQLWAHNIVTDANSQVPEWGFAGSPLVFDSKVVVSAGGAENRSLLAYEMNTGNLLWSGGNQPAGYGSPFLARISGVPQILAFNSGKISAHDPASGRVLWEYPWGNGHPHVAVPVVVDTNKVLFSSGYGVGSELLEIRTNGVGSLEAHRLWQSRKMKAKFANLVETGGFLYGLDDGMLACLDLKDGSERWKEGRYGHGQGLLVRDLFLLMAENGELVLLRPSAESPNELHRFRVFTAKTWNPIALAGDLLLVRNDQEAACLRLPISPSSNEHRLAELKRTSQY